MAKQKTAPNKTPKKPAEDPNRDDDAGNDDDDDDDAGDDEELEKKINSIVTNRLKRGLKPLEKLLGDMNAKLETFGKPATTPADDDDDDDDEGEGQQPATGAQGQQPATGAQGAQTAQSPADKKWRKKMERQLKEEQDARKAAEQKQAEQEAKSKAEEEKSQIMSALAKAGITDPKAQRAAFLTMKEDGLITRDDDGQVCIKSTDKYGEEILLAPNAGAGQWAKAEGKSFMPAVDASGSGGGGAANVNESARKMSKSEYSKLDKVQQAKIEIWRASNGMPPLGEDA